jgi:hypothetical protein
MVAVDDEDDLRWEGGIVSGSERAQKNRPTKKNAHLSILMRN